MNRFLILSAIVLFVLSLVPGALAQDDGYTIAFVPGVNPDTFYITMSGGSIRRRPILASISSNKIHRSLMWHFPCR